MNIYQRLARNRILPAIRIDDPDHAVPIAQALVDGGIDMMEITMRTEVALEGVRRIRSALPAVLVGAGTVIHPCQIASARAAGAQFGLSPGYHPAVIEALADWPFIPGVATPGEIEQALVAGLTWQKLFPAHVCGGPRYLNALMGPYAHTGLRLVPFGGVGDGDLVEYLTHPMVGAVGGTWLVPAGVIATRDWSRITLLARRAMETAHAIASISVVRCLPPASCPNDR